MKLLKIFSGKPLKRAEVKVHSDDSKVRVRASRTGGVNAAYHPLRGLTFNTKYGLRASKTFKGLTLGVQGGNSVVRGRWSTKNQLLNLNLSKSGFSISSKSQYGTYNFTNPNRSSFKFAGIQVRGKKAAGPALFFTVLTLIPHIIAAIFNLVALLFRVCIFLIRVLMAFVPVLIDCIYFLLNLILFLAIDLPKQLYNGLTKEYKFDTEIEGIIECEKIKEETQEVKDEIHKEIEKNDALGKEGLKLSKIECSLDLQIADINKKLEELKSNREKINKERISSDIEKIKINIEELEGYRNTSNFKKIIYYTLYLFGLFFLSFPVMFCIIFISDPMWIIGENISSIFIFISLLAASAFIGLKAINPGRNLLKLINLNKNLEALQNV